MSTKAWGTQAYQLFPYPLQHTQAYVFWGEAPLCQRRRQESPRRSTCVFMYVVCLPLLTPSCLPSFRSQLRFYLLMPSCSVRAGPVIYDMASCITSW
jgi:hypothetical protein